MTPTYRIIKSQRHDFLFHPEFHPNRVGQVAMVGWDCIAECTLDGVTRTAQATLGLDQQATEATAKDLAAAAASYAPATLNNPTT